MMILEMITTMCRMNLQWLI